MNLTIQNISFKAVVPRSKTKVQNKETGKFEPAIFCEVDCKDRYDCITFSKLSSDWEYAQGIESSAEWKYFNQTNGYSDARCHYILKKRNGEILAICRTTEECGEIRVDYLESKPESKYRYAGQMILSGIAKQGIKKGYHSMIVPSPVRGSERFYNDICGFKTIGKMHIMGNQDLIEFSKRKPNQR